MTEETQLSLDLVTPPDTDGLDPNRKIFLINFIQSRPLSSHQSWKIYRSYRNFKNPEPTYWLGIRTFYYDTDHDYLEQVSREEGLWLIKYAPVSTHYLDSLK